MRPTTKQRERRFRLRWRPNVVLGVVLGLVFGSGVGAVVWAFEPGSRGMWASIVTGTILGFVLGAFEGGMSAFESPQPGQEPFQIEYSVCDVSDLTQRHGESHRDGGRVKGRGRTRAEIAGRLKVQPSLRG